MIAYLKRFKQEVSAEFSVHGSTDSQRYRQFRRIG